MKSISRIVFASLLLAALPSAADRAGPSVLAAQPSAAVRSPGRDPVLFVHGWRGHGRQWRAMVDRFRADGWRAGELYWWTYDSGRSNEVLAAQLAARVDQILAATRAERVDIVTHSMGALPARFYLKNLEGDEKVDAWVSLAGPNHGTTVAELCFSASCREMRAGSAFLAALNEGDETPGGARYATWWSPCDEVIDPDTSVVLRGAVNRRTACIGHVQLLHDAAVYREVRDFISRPPPREWLPDPDSLR